MNERLMVKGTRNLKLIIYQKNLMKPIPLHPIDDAKN